jgi:hypothetical protein
MLEHERGVDQMDGLQFRDFFRQVHAVKLQVMNNCETPPDGLQVQRVHVQPYDAPGNLAVDALESIAAGDTENRDGLGPAACEGVRE